MSEYELTIIFSPEVAEEELTAIVEKVSQSITQKGGEVIEVNRWGRRKLAYPIKRFREGQYVLVKFKLQPTLAAEIETSLRNLEEVLRFLLVRLENKRGG